MQVGAGPIAVSPQTWLCADGRRSLMRVRAGRHQAPRRIPDVRVMDTQTATESVDRATQRADGVGWHTAPVTRRGAPRCRHVNEQPAHSPKNPAWMPTRSAVTTAPPSSPAMPCPRAPPVRSRSAARRLRRAGACRTGGGMPDLLRDLNPFASHFCAQRSALRVNVPRLPATCFTKAPRPHPPALRPRPEAPTLPARPAPRRAVSALPARPG